MFLHQCGPKCVGGCDPEETEDARNICRSCPVLWLCHDWVLTDITQQGVAAAMTERERKQLRRRHRNG